MKNSFSASNLRYSLVLLTLPLLAIVLILFFQKSMISFTSLSFSKGCQKKSFVFVEKNVNSSKINTTSNLMIDSVEERKIAWGALLQNHEYYNRPKQSKEDWRKIPKKDRPQLAAEQNYLMTMDPTIGKVPYERFEKASQYVDELIKNKAAISGIQWQERGPSNVGGRTRAIMFDPNDASHKKVWAGGVAGGLWYTNDITASEPIWNHVNDFWDNISISSMVYNPANSLEFYVATGEGWYNSDAMRGGGIWKTTDGGATWNLLASTSPGAYSSVSHFHYINKLVVKNDGTLFAATRGYYSNTGGILRSTDGGVTWTKVLAVYTGAAGLYDWGCDVEVAANGDVFAAFGVFSSGKVFKSTAANNGASGTWTDLSTNIGMANAKRIELACAPSDASVIYAIAHGGSGDNDIEWFKKSSDGGTTWSSITIPRLIDDGTTHFTRGQAFYDLILTVHPTNSSCILVGGIDIHRSTNAGSTWTSLSHWYGGFSKPEVHADNHCIAFRPGASNEVLFGNDGGVYFSSNAGDIAATPSFQTKNSGYNVTQFYACATKNSANSQYFLAGAQDNGSQQFTQTQINETNEVTGGDGAFCHIDQQNSDIQLTAYTYNTIYRSLNGGNSFSTIVSDNTGHFINPSEYDSQRKILYAASNNDLLKRISGIDATINNADLSLSLGTSQISALKMSPYNDVLFIGVANGRLYKLSNASTATPTLTRIDNGTTPITNTGWVSSIDVGSNDNQVLVTYSNYGVVSVWETSNGGTVWYNKEGNLPDMPIRWAIYNPDNRNQVLLATELGVWSTDNFGPATSSSPVWGASNNNLAHTRCDMLKYRSSDKLVCVATHGRGLYTCDYFCSTSLADFSWKQNYSCAGSLTVDFLDASLKPNGSWNWDVNNDGINDYTSQNPSHTYSVPGSYSVKLTINSGANSLTKENVIIVTSGEPSACTSCTVAANSNSANTYGIGIYRFALNDINHSSSNNDGVYSNFSCTDITNLKLNTLYNVSIQTGTANNEGLRFYIDYNDNGSYEAGESVLSFPANKDGARTLSFTTPASGVVMNKSLRARVVSKFNSIPTNACDAGSYGQVEDYSVYFASHSGPLPVELISFYSVCSSLGTNIHWETGSERNNSLFILEKSSDGINFSVAASVNGAGNSNSKIQYSFIDTSFQRQNWFYRLKQIDFNGDFSYSNIISGNCLPIYDIKVYPNPSSGVLHFEGIRSPSMISIYDLTGKLVFSSFVDPNNTSLDLSSLQQGFFELKITNEFYSFFQKIMIE